MVSFSKREFLASPVAAALALETAARAHSINAPEVMRDLPAMLGPYKTAPEILGMLADIVSKNGNMLLNVVLYPDGSLPPQSDQLLRDLAAWMKVNSEAIHGTRPWKIYGEGPTKPKPGAFSESGGYIAQDIRFTTKGGALYAITLGEPRGTTAIQALASSNAYEQRPVRRVELLGYPGGLTFHQTDSALLIDVPANLPTAHSSVFKISFA